MMKLKPYDFVGNKKKFFIISLSLFVVILAVSLIFGVKMDVKFTGGTIITYNYTGDINFDELDKFVQDTINEDITIDKKAGIAGGANSFDIVLASKDGLAADKQSALSNALSEKYKDQLQFLSNSSVDPVIGKEFFQKGLTAVLFASIILVIYIALRFKKINGMSAGIAAVAALLHDVIIVFGTFVIFRIPLDDNFIAVVLTILGYSINDTIVIYDRIRENKKIYGGKNLPVRDLVNNSINETLTRTLGTSGAVFGTLIIVCIVAFVTNVPSIISFALPMLIGAISGTYSTIFIAGPLWVMWQEHKKKLIKEGKMKPQHKKTSKV